MERLNKLFGFSQQSVISHAPDDVARAALRVSLGPIRGWRASRSCLRGRNGWSSQQSYRSRRGIRSVAVMGTAVDVGGACLRVLGVRDEDVGRRAAASTSESSYLGVGGVGGMGL